MNLKEEFKMKEKINKYKDVIPYLFFGVCTTLVNMLVYWVCAHVFNLSVLISTVISWVLSVLFAYVTNRKYVFHSEVTSTKGIIKEISSFFSCRVLTGVVDLACMLIFVDIFNMNDMVMKIVANVIVIILNYVASKLLIFKHTVID